MFKNKKSIYVKILTSVLTIFMISLFLGGNSVEATNTATGSHELANQRLNFNTWYYMRNDHFSGRGGVIVNSSGWTRVHNSPSNNGERIRFINP